MISVIIPTYNRPVTLKDCLEQLKFERQGLSQVDYEIIVSDDSRVDDTKPMIRMKFPDVRWVEGPRKGPAANRNNGAKNGIGNWCLFVDDDCIPDTHLIRSYIAALQAYSEVHVFEGKIKADRKQKYILEEAPLNENGGYLWSCNFMIDRTVFLDHLHGFDEDFPFAAMEDVDLHHRIKLNKYEVVFVKEAVVVHPWRLQTNYLKMVENRIKSIHYFWEKFPEMRDKATTGTIIKSELRFYIKNVLFNILKFGPSGVFTLLRAHFAAKKVWRECDKLLNQNNIIIQNSEPK